MERDVEVEILDLLKRAGDGYTSGETISRTLGISRTAVWKHIRGLKKKGFSIEAGHSKGYRLRKGARPFNDVEVRAGLGTEFIGREILFYESIDSTNTRAYELARCGAREGTAVIAETQTSGRGRLKREWFSPPGVNLYTSIILKPPVPPYEAPRLTLTTAVAVAESISKVLPGRIGVKWPNDILIGSKKVAGILTEMKSEMDVVNFVVVGIGVNINMEISLLPDELRGRVTSLKEESGREVCRVGFTRDLYSSIEKWYKIYIHSGFSTVREGWRSFFNGEGKPVRVRCLDRVVDGMCMGIDRDGALLVKTHGGVERINCGDVER